MVAYNPMFRRSYPRRRRTTRKKKPAKKDKIQLQKKLWFPDVVNAGPAGVIKVYRMYPSNATAADKKRAAEQGVANLQERSKRLKLTNGTL